MSNIIKIQDLEKLFSKEIISLYNKANDSKTSPAEQKKIYATIITKAPEFLPAYNNLGELQIQNGQYEQAIQTLRQGLEKHQASQKSKDKLKDYEDKTKIFGQEMVLMLRLNMAVAVNGVSNIQYDLLSKILMDWPLSGNPLVTEHAAHGSFLYGQALYFKQQYELALPHLEFAYENLNRPSQVQSMLADAYYQAEKFSESAQLYESFVDKKSDFNLRQRRGMALLRGGQFDQAEKVFTELLDEFLDKSGRRKEYEAMLAEINAKKNANRSDEANKKIKEIEKNKDLPQDQKDRELGFLYIMKGEYNKAMSFLGKAAKKIKQKFTK